MLTKTTQYHQRFIRESLEIMKNKSYFNWEDEYKLSNTRIIILRDRRRNHNFFMGLAQRISTLTNQRSEE